jgi:hypothetical protein
MKRHLICAAALASAISLGGCISSDNPIAQAPLVTTNPTTGVATAAAPTPKPASGGPLDFIAVDLGNDLALDVANEINIATAAKDQLGLTCGNDWAALIAASKSGTTSGTAPNLGTLHVLTDAEKIRLQLISLGSAGGQMAVMQKTFNDCLAVIRDDEARGIQVAAGFKALQGNLALALVGLPTSLPVQ